MLNISFKNYYNRFCFEEVEYSQQSTAVQCYKTHAGNAFGGRGKRSKDVVGRSAQIFQRVNSVMPVLEIAKLRSKNNINSSIVAWGLRNFKIAHKEECKH